MNDIKMAKEMVSLARELSALGIGQELAADPERVDDLATKFLARLSGSKTRQLKVYGLELKPTDTVESLAKAWATVLLAQ